MPKSKTPTLFRNWRAIAGIQDPYIQKTLTEAPLSSDEELQKRFPEFYSESADDTFPIPWNELIKKALEIQRRDHQIDPYIPGACEELGIPFRQFCTLEDGQPGYGCEYLSMENAYNWIHSKIGDVIPVESTDYIVISTNLSEDDKEWIDERWPWYCTVKLVLASLVTVTKTA